MAKKKHRKPSQKQVAANSTPLNPTDKSRLEEARKLCRSATKYIRNLTRYRTALEVLDDYGISGKKALHPLMYCMTFLGENRRKTHVLHLSEALLNQTAKPDPEITERSPDDLQAQIRELQMENQRLRTSLYEAGRKARDTRKKLESMETSAREDRQELADLWELVFHQQENTYFSEPEDISIAFPYDPAAQR